MRRIIAVGIAAVTVGCVSPEVTVGPWDHVIPGITFDALVEDGRPRASIGPEGTANTPLEVESATSSNEDVVRVRGIDGNVVTLDSIAVGDVEIEIYPKRGPRTPYHVSVAEPDTHDFRLWKDDPEYRWPAGDSIVITNNLYAGAELLWTDGQTFLKIEPAQAGELDGLALTPNATLDLVSEVTGERLTVYVE